MRGLYAIVDLGALAARQLDPAAFAGAVLRVRPAALQLRAKDWEALPFMRLAEKVMAAARTAGVPFIVNDRPDIALAVGADGVHLGQLDLPVEWARRAPMLDGDMIEVRQVQEMSEFPPDVQAAAGMK